MMISNGLIFLYALSIVKSFCKSAVKAIHTFSQAHQPDISIDHSSSCSTPVTVQFMYLTIYSKISIPHI